MRAGPQYPFSRGHPGAHRVAQVCVRAPVHVCVSRPGWCVYVPVGNFADVYSPIVTTGWEEDPHPRTDEENGPGDIPRPSSSSGGPQGTRQPSLPVPPTLFLCPPAASGQSPG